MPGLRGLSNMSLKNIVFIALAPRQPNIRIPNGLPQYDKRHTLQSSEDESDNDEEEEEGDRTGSGNHHDDALDDNIDVDFNDDNIFNNDVLNDKQANEPGGQYAFQDSNTPPPPAILRTFVFLPASENCESTSSFRVFIRCFVSG